MVNQSMKECQRCSATTKAGSRCRNRTCRGTTCWQHLKSKKGLRVKQSQVPHGGLGLWTTKRYKPNEKIGKYKGEKLTKAQVNQRYGSRTGEYVYCPTAGSPLHLTTCRKSYRSAGTQLGGSRWGLTNVEHNYFLALAMDITIQYIIYNPRNTLFYGIWCTYKSPYIRAT